MEAESGELEVVVRESSEMSPERLGSVQIDGPLLSDGDAGVLGEAATKSVPPISSRIAESAGIELYR